MPVTVRREGKKFRVVESDSGRIVKNVGESEADGGGHSTRAKAESQAHAINAELKQRGKI